MRCEVALPVVLPPLCWNVSACVDRSHDAGISQAGKEIQQNLLPALR